MMLAAGDPDGYGTESVSRPACRSHSAQDRFNYPSLPSAGAAPGAEHRLPGAERKRDLLSPLPPTEKAPAKLWRAILQSASQLASLLDSRSDMPFARLFPFGVIKQQGSGASFSEISSHALLG